jgi:hypothetical protein
VWVVQSTVIPELAPGAVDVSVADGDTGATDAGAVEPVNATAPTPGRSSVASWPDCRSPSPS